MDKLLGHVWFVDGVKRAIYEQPDRRQYVLDGKGVPIFGVWIIPEEETVQPDLIIEG